jgi:hypothetical protein
VSRSCYCTRNASSNALSGSSAKKSCLRVGPNILALPLDSLINSLEVIRSVSVFGIIGLGFTGSQPTLRRLGCCD